MFVLPVKTYLRHPPSARMWVSTEDAETCCASCGVEAPSVVALWGVSLWHCDTCSIAPTPCSTLALKRLLSDASALFDDAEGEVRSGCSSPATPDPLLCTQGRKRACTPVPAAARFGYCIPGGGSGSRARDASPALFESPIPFESPAHGPCGSPGGASPPWGPVGRPTGASPGNTRGSPRKRARSHHADQEARQEAAVRRLARLTVQLLDFLDLQPNAAMCTCLCNLARWVLVAPPSSGPSGSGEPPTTPSAVDPATLQFRIHACVAFTPHVRPLLTTCAAIAVHATHMGNCLSSTSLQSAVATFFASQVCDAADTEDARASSGHSSSNEDDHGADEGSGEEDTPFGVPQLPPLPVALLNRTAAWVRTHTCTLVPRGLTTALAPPWSPQRPVPPYPKSNPADGGTFIHPRDQRLSRPWGLLRTPWPHLQSVFQAEPWVPATDGDMATFASCVANLQTHPPFTSLHTAPLVATLHSSPSEWMARHPSHTAVSLPPLPHLFWWCCFVLLQHVRSRVAAIPELGCGSPEARSAVIVFTVLALLLDDDLDDDPLGGEHPLPPFFTPSDPAVPCAVPLPRTLNVCAAFFRAATCEVATATNRVLATLCREGINNPKALYMFPSP